MAFIVACVVESERLHSSLLTVREYPSPQIGLQSLLLRCADQGGSLRSILIGPSLSPDLGLDLSVGFRS